MRAIVGSGGGVLNYFSPLNRGRTPLQYMDGETDRHGERERGVCPSGKNDCAAELIFASELSRTGCLQSGQETHPCCLMISSVHVSQQAPGRVLTEEIPPPCRAYPTRPSHLPSFELPPTIKVLSNGFKVTKIGPKRLIPVLCHQGDFAPHSQFHKDARQQLTLKTRPISGR